MNPPTQQAGATTTGAEVQGFTSPEVTNNNSSIENYFERVNTEYRQSVLSGTHDESSMPEILERNSEGIGNFIADFFESPLEALKWSGTRLFEMIAGSWIADVTGILAPFRAMQERVMGLIENPFESISEIIDSLKNIPGLGNLDFSTADTLERSLVVISAIGINTSMITDFGAVYRHLRDNPEISRNATDEDLRSEAWWTTILDQLQIGPDNRASMIAVLSGSLPISRALGLAGGPAYTAQDSDIEYQSEMVGLDEFAQQRMEGFSSFLERLKDGFGEMYNNSPVATTMITGLLGYYLRGPLMFMGSAGLTGIRSLLTLAKIPVTIATTTGRLVPFGTIAMSMLMLAVAVRSYQNLSEVKIPSDPQEALAWFRRKLVNDPTWNRLQEQLPAEVRETADVAMEYAAGVRDFGELVVDGAEQVGNAIVAGSVEIVGLNEQELIQSSNSRGLINVRYYLNDPDNTAEMNAAELESFKESLNAMIEVLETGGVFSAEMLAELIQKGQAIGIAIVNDGDGYYTWAARNSMNEYTVPETLCIDPALTVEEQKEKALRFSISQNWVGGVGESLVNQVRTTIEGLRDSEGNPIESIEDAADWLKGQISLGKLGWVVAHDFYLEGMLLGPIEVWGGALEILGATMTEGSVGAEVNEFALDYADGIIPIVVIGTIGGSSLDMIKGRGPRIIANVLNSATMPLRYAVKVPVASLQFMFKQKYRARVLDNLLNEGYTGRFFTRFNMNLSQETLRLSKLYELDRFLKNSEGTLRYIGVSLPRVNSNEFITEVTRRLDELRNLGIDLGNRPASLTEFRSLQTALGSELNARSINFGVMDGARNLSRRAGTAIGDASRNLSSRLGGLPPLPRPTVTRGGRAGIVAGLAATVGGIAYGVSGRPEVEDQVTLDTVARVQSANPENGALDSVRDSFEAAETVDTGLEFLDELYLMNNAYREVRDFLNPTNLENTDEDSAFIRIQDLGENLHVQQVERFNNFVRANKPALVSILQSNPEVAPLILAEGAYQISLDADNPAELKIEYSDANAYCQMLWENYDMIRTVEAASAALGEEGLITRMRQQQESTGSQIEAVMQNQALTDEQKNEQIIQILESYQVVSNEISNSINGYSRTISAGGLALDILPGTGSFRDLDRVEREFSRGNLWNGAINSLSFAATTIGDVLSLGTVGTALRGTRLAAKFADIARVYANLNRGFEAALTACRAGRGLTRVMDAAIAAKNTALLFAVGLDVGRTLLIPPTLNQNLTI